MRREDVDDPVDGLHGVARVQRGEREVAGLRDRQRRLDGLDVAHLADEHDVGVLPEKVPQRLREAVGVASDLALVDEAVFVLVDEFDGILDGHDVVVLGCVDVVDHGGEGRGFSGAGGAGDEDEPLGLFAKLDARPAREAEVVEAADGVRDEAENAAGGSSLEEEVCPEAAHVFHAEGEIELQILFEAGDLALAQDAVQEFLRFFGGERVEFQGHKAAVDADPRRGARGDVEVGASPLNHDLKKFFEADHGMC